MPGKTKSYALVKFPPAVIEEAISVAQEHFDDESQVTPSITVATTGTPSWSTESWRVGLEHEVWKLDSRPEFYAEYQKNISWAYLEIAWFRRVTSQLTIHYQRHATEISVTLATRKGVERVSQVFERNHAQYSIPPKDAKRTIQESVAIFIGHGRNPQWRDLKDHLQEQHRFKVITYESGPRAGYTISETLDEMGKQASFALLVHTGEDEGADSVVRARENVIHETGLFQGKLGVRRAIVLLEEGCNQFSNIDGLQQIRFSRGNIKEVFGDVLATIYREFGAPN